MGSDVLLVDVRGLHDVQVLELMEVGGVQIAFEESHGLIKVLLSQ